MLAGCARFCIGTQVHLIHIDRLICTCMHRSLIRNVCPTDERAVSRKRITGRAEEHSSRRESEVLIRSRSREDRTIEAGSRSKGTTPEDGVSRRESERTSHRKPETRAADASRKMPGRPDGPEGAAPGAGQESGPPEEPEDAADGASRTLNRRRRRRKRCSAQAERVDRRKA